MPKPTIDELLDRTIAAYKEGDISKASELLARVIQLDPNSERAWLWLSGVVATDAERLFCVKRILAINPHNEIAQRGLERLPTDLVPVQPSLEKQKEQNAEICTFPGCNKPVSKSGYKFCYKHWKAVNGPIEPAANLNATELGERVGLSSRRVNLVLAELGWVSKQKKGWIPTQQGAALGAVVKEHYQTGIPYVLWPETVVHHKALLKTVKNLRGEAEEFPAKSTSDDNGFREKFPANYRATDGHWVRSKAEMLIDNWLYMSGVVHAYERQVPVEEELYCDFYIPEGKVYIEYWGLENDAKYLVRKKVKIGLYQKYKLNLIEITDEQVKNLDDFLPKAFLKFNIALS